ncbi:unnamed protein product [Effrenium voratum]|nr:unnamed protein product [Effrenium voratum]CAJ1440506.1 unnamed protein product [Effrenium voratum]CAJ1456299.1 unnamed protein product [Effrenium voratum]
MLAYTAPDKMVVSSNDVKRSFSNKECLMKIQEYEKIRNIVVQMANARGQSLQPWERLRLLGEFDCACAAVVLDKKHKDWPLEFDSLKAVGNWFAERLSQKTECEVPKPFDEPKPTGRGLTPSSRGAACSSKETLPKPALAGSSVRIRELAEDGSLADTSGLSDKGFSAGVKVVDKKSKKEGVILSTDTCNVHVEWCDSGSTEAVKTSLFLEGAFRPLANQKVHQEVELTDFRSSPSWLEQRAKSSTFLALHELSEKLPTFEFILYQKPKALKYVGSNSVGKGKLQLAPVTTKVVLGSAGSVVLGFVELGGEKKTVCLQPCAAFTSPFWHMKTSKDPEECNMILSQASQVKLSLGKVSIQVAKNTQKIEPGDFLCLMSSEGDGEEHSPPSKRQKQ